MVAGTISHGVRARDFEFRVFPDLVAVCLEPSAGRVNTLARGKTVAKNTGSQQIVYTGRRTLIGESSELASRRQYELSSQWVNK